MHRKPRRLVQFVRRELTVNDCQIGTPHEAAAGLGIFKAMAIHSVPKLFGGYAIIVEKYARTRSRQSWKQMQQLEVNSVFDDDQIRTAQIRAFSGAAPGVTGGSHGVSSDSGVQVLLRREVNPYFPLARREEAHFACQLAPDRISLTGVRRKKGHAHDCDPSHFDTHARIRTGPNILAKICKPGKTG